jgi:hypothetical protein
MKAKKIEDYTSAELRILATQKEKEEFLNSIPKPVDNINWNDIIDSTDRLMKAIALGNFQEDDIQNCYEWLLETIYGDDVFDWINKRL